MEEEVRMDKWKRKEECVNERGSKMDKWKRK
jgi:hypothetical protein